MAAAAQWFQDAADRTREGFRAPDDIPTRLADWIRDDGGVQLPQRDRTAWGGWPDPSDGFRWCSVDAEWVPRGNIQWRVRKFLATAQPPVDHFAALKLLQQPGWVPALLCP